MANFGVNITIKESTNITKVDSSTIIGAVVTLCAQENEEIEPLCAFSSAQEAIEKYKHCEGTALRVLQGIIDQNTSCRVLLSIIPITQEQAQKSAEEFYEAPEVKTKIINGIDAFKQCGMLFGKAPDLIIAPFFSHNSDVGAQMQTTAERLSAIGIIDLNADSQNDSIAKRDNYNSKRIIVTDPYVKVWDRFKNEEVFEPMSARLAALIAHTDGVEEYGFSNSHSNRVLNGVTGAKRIIDFEPGQECEADTIRNKNITTLIRYDGFRVWGNHTTSIDPIWEDVTRVRVFDYLAKAAIKAIFFAIDARADNLKAAKDSVEQMLLALKGSRVLVDYEVRWDEEKNTLANITAGKFFLTIDVMNTPIVKRLEVNFNYTDRFSDVLIKTIS